MESFQPRLAWRAKSACSLILNQRSAATKILPVRPDGFRPDDFRPDGYWPDGYWPDGYWPNGYWPNGYWPNGYWL